MKRCSCWFQKLISATIARPGWEHREQGARHHGARKRGTHADPSLRSDRVRGKHHQPAPAASRPRRASHEPVERTCHHRFRSHEAGRSALEDGRLTFVEADVTEPDSPGPPVQGVDAIVQAAQFAGAPVEDPARGLTYMNVDRNGTVNLLAAVAAVYGRRRRRTRRPAPGDSPPLSLHERHQRLRPDTPRPMGPGQVAGGGGHARQRARLDHRPGLLGLRARGRRPQPPPPLLRLPALRAHLRRWRGYSRRSSSRTSGGSSRSLLATPKRASTPSSASAVRTWSPSTEFLRLALTVMGRERPILHIPKSVGKVQGALMQHLPGRPLSPDAVDFVSQAERSHRSDRRLHRGTVSRVSAHVAAPGTRELPGADRRPPDAPGVLRCQRRSPLTSPRTWRRGPWPASRPGCRARWRGRRRRPPTPARPPGSGSSARCPPPVPERSAAP